MRARNREINIFNMSLLDILCGALGAFCFMMLVLLPYYKPGAGADAQKQQELDETLKDIDKLKEKLKDAELAKELAELIEKLKAQIKELEGRVNSLQAQNQQLQGQVDDLTAKNKQLQSEKQEMQKRLNDLERREPFSVFMTLMAPLELGQRGQVHLYLWQDTLTVKKEPQKPFDPRKETDDPFWIGEQYYGVNGRNPYSSWMILNADAGVTWKIYVKLDLWTQDPTDANKKIPVPIPGNLSLIGSVNSAGGVLALPDVTVSTQHPWVLAGIIKTDKSDNTKLTVRGATDAERAAEWKALDRK